MSDEKDIGEKTFEVHHPDWRSDEVNTLLADLDARANTDPSNKLTQEKTMSKKHP